MNDAAQAGFGFADGGPDHERLRKFDADFTPGAVVKQGLLWVRRNVIHRPLRILDPSGGAGVFGQQAKIVWPTAFRTAVEPREEEEEHLWRNNDEVRIETFQSAAKCMGTGVRFPLIVTNPPFSFFPEFVELGHPLLGPRGALVLLGLSTWGQSQEGIELFARFPPTFQLRIGGRVGYRGPGINPKNKKPWGVDQRDYSWWGWVPCAPPLVWAQPAKERENEDEDEKAIRTVASWRTLQLPALSTPQRTWRVRPGTEELAA